jgi:hypothetical protein
LKTASVLLDDTAPSLLPAWCLLGLSSLLRTPERSLSTLEACGGPLGPPSLRFLHFQSPGWFLAETPARTATEFDCSNLCSDKDSDDSSWCVGYEYIPVTPGAGTRRFTSTCRLFDDCTKVKEEAAAVKEAEAQAEKIRAEKEEEERLEAEARARAEKAEKERKEAEQRAKAEKEEAERKEAEARARAKEEEEERREEEEREEEEWRKKEEELQKEAERKAEERAKAAAEQAEAEERARAAAEQEERQQAEAEESAPEEQQQQQGEETPMASPTPAPYTGERCLRLDDTDFDRRAAPRPRPRCAPAPRPCASAQCPLLLAGGFCPKRRHARRRRTIASTRAWTRAARITPGVSTTSSSSSAERARADCSTTAPRPLKPLYRRRLPPRA